MEDTAKQQAARIRKVKKLVLAELQRSGSDTCAECGEKITDFRHIAVLHEKQVVAPTEETPA